MTVVAAEAEWDAQISINAIADVVICFFMISNLSCKNNKISAIFLPPL